MIKKLKKEIETYEAHKVELIAEHKGKFALIKDNQVIGIFSTNTEATYLGKESFGREPFLVKQILDMNSSEELSSNVFKIMNAIKNYASTK